MENNKTPSEEMIDLVARYMSSKGISFSVFALDPRIGAWQDIHEDDVSFFCNDREGYIKACEEDNKK